MTSSPNVPPNSSASTGDARAGSAAWRAEQARLLLQFARGAADARGYGWLDDRGHLDASAGRPLWITARMTHVWSLAAVAGVDDARELAALGVRAMREDFADGDHDGWFAALDIDGRPTDTTKANYEHAFVLLSSASAAAADIDGAGALFDQAQDVVASRFWRDNEGRAVESYDRTFANLELYRGANSNMHSVEAYLAAADVSGDVVWRDRAMSIAERIIHRAAREQGYRVPEHFDPEWHFVPDYNHDRPDDPFRPYGATPGHGLEWSRLLVNLHAALPDPPSWLIEDAVGLFDVAVGDGWRADGHPGFVYTTDWDGRPVTTTRMHWVMAEGVLAADALHRATGDDRPAEIARSWWEEISRYFVDTELGSWHHELAPEMTLSTTTWRGKPDVYHAYQACVLPSLPLAPVAAVALQNATSS